MFFSRFREEEEILEVFSIKNILNIGLVNYLQKKTF